VKGKGGSVHGSTQRRDRCKDLGQNEPKTRNIMSRFAQKAYIVFASKHKTLHAPT
jgi:hypothetical protein